MVAAQARGLGFSVTFAGQDWAGIKRGSETEAEQIWSNCKIKIFGTLLDNESLQRLKVAVGEAEVTQTQGFALTGMGVGGYADNLTASVASRSRVDVRDMANQTEGEAHIVIGGNMIRANTFYAAHDNGNLPSYHINRFLRIGEKLAIDNEAAATDEGDGPSRTLDMGNTGAGGTAAASDHAHERERQQRRAQQARAAAQARQSHHDPQQQDLQRAHAESERREKIAAQRRRVEQKAAMVEFWEQREAIAQAQAGGESPFGLPPDLGGTGEPPTPKATQQDVVQAALEAAAHDSSHNDSDINEAALSALSSDAVIAQAERQLERDMDMLPAGRVPIADVGEISLDDNLYGPASDEAAADHIERAINTHPDADLNARADTLSTSELRDELQSAINQFLGR